MRRYRANKYGNKKIELDGITFDSIAEARRYSELKLLEKAGEIKELELQKPFVIQPSFFDADGKRQTAIKYYADFVYWRKDDGNEESFPNGYTYIIEDVKSPATKKDRVYKLKKKMMAYNGYVISEYPKEDREWESR